MDCGKSVDGLDSPSGNERTKEKEKHRTERGVKQPNKGAPPKTRHDVAAAEGELLKPEEWQRAEGGRE